jgi:hypothetical protein
MMQNFLLHPNENLPVGLTHSVFCEDGLIVGHVAVDESRFLLDAATLDYIQKHGPRGGIYQIEKRLLFVAPDGRLESVTSFRSGFLIE